MSVNGSTTNRMATMRYMRMLPRGNQWGFRGLSSASKKVPMDGNPGLGFRVGPDAVAITRGLGQHPVHAVGLHVYRALVWMESVSLIPVHPVDAQAQGNEEYDRQQKPG